MITIEVNGKTVEVEKEEILLTVLEREGIKIPTLCNMRDLFPSGACRMCVVEVEGFGGLVPSCAYPVFAGMKVQTHSPRVVRARSTIIELLLASHPDDCLYCGRNYNCELRQLAAEYNITGRKFIKSPKKTELDVSSPSLVRDAAKCILCGRCVRVCEEVMGVSAIDFSHRGSKTTVTTAFDEGLNSSSCVSCGQCIVACPTNALSEKNNIKEVVAALKDPTKYVVVQHAPSVSVTLGEYFDTKPGKDVDGLMVAALRKLGFNKVFDTGFSADLTIMEEASELVHRIGNNGTLPMFTSCSPAWINFVEEFYPDYIPNLSTCKSPQQMMGALIKSYFAKKEEVSPDKIVSVSIMPCTAKKREAGRGQMVNDEGHADVDYVLTTRELAKLITEYGIEFEKLKEEVPDQLLGVRTGAGKIFGATGGVMEAALRTGYHFITGKELAELNFKQVRGMQGLKEATVEIDNLKLHVAIVSGLGNAKKLLENMRKGLCNYHFIEIMSCPGGCVAGGGQPLKGEPEKIKARMKSLYDIDAKEKYRCAHQNPFIKELYREFLGKPLGHLSHELLHTNYSARKAD